MPQIVVNKLMERTKSRCMYKNN